VYHIAIFYNLEGKSYFKINFHHKTLSCPN
jgi:hypothetical protein